MTSTPRRAMLAAMRAVEHCCRPPRRPRSRAPTESSRSGARATASPPTTTSTRWRTTAPPDAHHEPQPGRAESRLVAERRQDRVRAHHGLRSDIWIANADGTDLRQLTTTTPNDTRPAGPTRATKIVFASDRDSTPGHLRPLRDGRERREPGQHHEHPDDRRGLPVLVARRDHDRVLARRRHLQVAPNGTDLTR